MIDVQAARGTTLTGRTMTIDDDNRRLGSGAGMRAGSPPGPLTKLLGVVIGAAVVVASLLFSVVVFAIVLAVGAIAGAYLWWRTRELRRQIRAQMDAQMQAQREAAARQGRDGAQGWPEPGGASGRNEDVVIEGDYIREAPDQRSTPSDDADRPSR
jgi:Flp pilus assembly protein TadB